ncbi:MAG: hypothetical protein LBN12_08785 [Clostridiales Family XIII bacterium]|jgi:hypothetical protein|nr:hypothetical protein [Clostridiales Family XIII bacterium]
MNILKNTRGSLAVEAAIILPLFIIGILTLGYLIKFTMAGEGVFHALADETGKFTAEAASPLGIAAYEKDVRARAEYESLGDVSGAQVSGLYRIPYIGKSGNAYTNLVGVSVTWDTPIGLPRLAGDSLGGQETILARAFVGGSNGGNPLPFSEMEISDGGGTVWVFPRAGERYHTEHCTVIENNPRERLLDRSVRSQYQPCTLCGAQTAHEGDLVYCFPASGRAFHTGDCHLVERYVIEIDREDAKKQGYTPCTKCGGGG